ncbi:MAG TPA: adenylate/guanylate cyclase domain-containing protein [Solirubrobacteraceae bacterium]
MTVRPGPPVGTIALLFTDIEGSTWLASQLGRAWPEVLAEHHALINSAIAAEGGFVDGTEGDAFFVTFADPAAAARAAVAAQRALHARIWPEQVGELRVRMGLHVGYVERGRTGYVGLEVHRAARVAAAAHGGQLLLTAGARELVGEVVATQSVGVHRLKDFPAPVQLYCAVVDGRGAEAFPPPRTHEVRPTNLPAGAPALIGRELDLERVRSALLVDGERLVTLTGRGGSGKTSLAQAAAAQFLDEYPGGVWWADLATVRSPDEVPGVVAAALGSERDVDGSPLHAIEARLRTSGATLLILDNMEQVRTSSGWLAELMGSLPELRLLITSQVPLRLPEERVIQLDALDDDSAVILIEQVARRRGGTIPSDAGSQAALLEVVRSLDGLPLALELAAARLSLLSAAQLRDRLRESSDVLRDPAGGRAERQRSLRATVEWTLGLLDDPTRALFSRMGAFAHPVELEELEAVADGDGVDVLDGLARLLDVALVRRVESGDGRVRFGLPEALRQISARLLDASSDGKRWRRAHAQRQYELAWSARTTACEGATFRAAILGDAEIAAALRWAQENGDPLWRPIAAARASLLVNIGRLREAMTVLDWVLQSPPEDRAVHALALTARAVAQMAVGEPQAAMGPAEEAVRIAGDPLDVCFALTTRGLVKLFCGDPQAAVIDYEEATRMARDLGPGMLAGALVWGAQARMSAGDVELARANLQEARRIGAPIDASALRYIDTLEGDIAMLSGRPGEALEPYARSLESARDRHDALQILFDLRGLANAMASLQRDPDALQLLGLVERQAEEVGGPGVDVGSHLQGNDGVLQAESRLGPEEASAQRARGRAVPAGYRVDHACQLARALAIV